MDVVLNWLWQGSAIALAAAVSVALTKPSARVRYGVWMTALVLVAIIPLVGILRQMIALAASMASTSMPPPAAALPSSAFLQLPHTWWASSAVTIGICAGWASVHAARLSSALLTLARARRRCQSLSPAVESRLALWTRLRTTGRRTRLVLSNGVQSAAVLGGPSPMIALAPTLVADLSTEEVDCVVAHEWAHVQRRDDVAALAQAMVRVLAGWHPAVWWLDRRISAEREHACDEAVITLTGSAKAYAACLVKVASLSMQPVRPLPVVAMSGFGLRARVMRILTRHATDLSPRRGASLAVAAALSTLAIAIADVRLIESAAPQAPQQAAGEPHVAAPPLLSLGTSTATRSESLPSAAAGAEATRKPRPEAAAPPAAAPARPEVTDAALQPSQPQHAERSAEASAEALQPLAVRPLVPTHDTMPALREALAAGGPWSAAATPQEPPAWGAAADAGVAIGRGSQKAGVATAGFFSRFGKKIASSF